MQSGENLNYVYSRPTVSQDMAQDCNFLSKWATTIASAKKEK